MGKSLYQSKTFWINVLAAIAACIQALQGQPWMDTEIQAAILAVVNIILRLMTSEPIKPSSLPTVILFLSVLLVPGCAGKTITADQLAAGSEYLNASLSTLEAANSRLSAEDQAKLAPVLSGIKTGVAAYNTAAEAGKAATADSGWAAIKSGMGTALQIVAPAALHALLAL